MARKHRDAARAEDTTGRISMVEVVSYTVTLGFIAAVALGWFDAMVPWK